MSARVLVTGGSGYLGRRTIPRLKAAGYDVVALARSSDAAELLTNLGAEIVRGDLDDPASLNAAFQSARADVLMNIASLGFGHAGTIVAACEECGIKRAIFVSTTAIFTRLNAGSKKVRVAAEHTIEASILDYTIVRPTMIYGGPDDRNIARLSTLVRKTPIVPLPGRGSRLQQPVHVEDLAAALVSCVDHPESIRSDFNLAGPEALTFRELVHRTARAQGRRVVTIPLPLAPIIAVTRSYEKHSKRPRLKAEQFERLAEDKQFDIDPARRVLDYEPRSFSEGLIGPAAEPAEGSGLDRPARIGRYARTLAHLHPRQVAARIRLRTQRALIRRAPWAAEQILLTRVHPHGDQGWPPGFESFDQHRFSDLAIGQQVLSGRFKFLNRTEVRGTDSIWLRVDVPQLWRFHLHYWDWAWGLTTFGDAGALALAELWHDWENDSTLGRGDAWSPYVVSLRLWTLCGLHPHLDSTPSFQKEVADAVRLHASYLRSNLETDVGGNHLVKNLKALVGAGVFLGDTSLTGWAVARVRVEVSKQVLPDGGHFELSPSYHAQVLGDLIDMAGLLNATNIEFDHEFLQHAVAAMRDWLGEFVGPDGTTPVLNDGVSLDGIELDRLGVHVSPTPRRLAILEDSGYVIARPRPDVHVVVDVGQPCPDSLPAHSQADCLTFVLGSDEGWIVVDTGTSEYGSGPRRQFERSTAAHNTVEVDATDQTEVWGAFRAGRRARPTIIAVSDDGECITVIAEHDGYRALPGGPVHRRQMTFRSDTIEVVDDVRGDDRHVVRSRLHLAAGHIERRSDAEVVWSNERSELVIQGGSIESDVAEYSIAFGRREAGHVLSQSGTGALPLTMKWKLTI